MKGKIALKWLQIKKKSSINSFYWKKEREKRGTQKNIHIMGTNKYKHEQEKRGHVLKRGAEELCEAWAPSFIFID